MAKPRPAIDRNLARNFTRERFAFLLARHLNAGTRPSGRGEPWSYEKFARDVQSSRFADDFVSPRTVSNWCKGKSLPLKVEPILYALFPAKIPLSSQRTELDAAFRAARAEKNAITVQRAKPHPEGAAWIAHGQQLRMEYETRQTDKRAATTRLQQQLQVEIRDMADHLAMITNQRPSNALLISKVSATAATIGILLNCDPKQIPDRLVRIYRHSLVLGELLDVDSAVRLDHSDAPLDAEIRGDMSSLVRMTAPWLRGFPSIVALDDKAGKLLFPPTLAAPALGFIQCAQNSQVISTENGSDVILGLSASHITEFKSVQPRYRGHKATTLAIGDTKNLVLAAVSKVAAVQSGISTQSADEEALVQNLAATLLAANVHVTALAETMQPDLKHAVNGVIEEVVLSRGKASTLVPIWGNEEAPKNLSLDMANFVFISYPAGLVLTATKFVRTLENSNISCWFATRDSRPSISHKSQIYEAIYKCDAVLLLFNGLCNDSLQIQREIQQARIFQKPIVPIRLEMTFPKFELGKALEDVQWIDAVHGLDQASDEILQAVRSAI